VDLSDYWTDTYGQIIEYTGWPLSVIDEMSWEEVIERQAYWQKIPPWQEFVKAFCGWEPPKKQTKATGTEKKMTEAELRAFADMFNTQRK